MGKESEFGTTSERYVKEFHYVEVDINKNVFKI